ncbi:MAG: mannosyltransferase [Solirubrobacteraceae bacterium]
MVVAAVTVIGVLLRLPSLGDSLFGDELSTYYTVAGHGLGRTVAVVRSDQELTPPVYYVLAWAASRFGDSPDALRLPSLFAGVAAIPLTYLLGVRTVGRRAAVVGSGLMAASPFLIFYSTEGRAYALMLVLGLLSTLALLRALDGPQRRWWVAYAACSCAALYTHYTVVFVLAAQFLWAFSTRPDVRRALLAANAAAALGFLPWVTQLLDDTRSPCADLIGGLQPFGLGAVRTDIGRWSIGHPYIALSSLPGEVALAMLVAGFAAAILGVVLRARTADAVLPSRPAAGVILILVLALAAPAGAALYSAIGTSVFTARNLVASSPGFALAAGMLLTAGQGVLRATAVSLVVAAFGIGGVQMIYSRNQRPDYAAAARFIDHSGAAGDPVIEVPFPTPGPLTATYVALHQAGRFALADHPLFQLGSPSIATQLRARTAGVGPCASVFLPPTPARTIASEASARPGAREVFLVTLGSLSLDALRKSTGSPPGQLLAAFPPRYGHVGTRRFPGLGGLTLSVYVFRARQPHA